MDIEWIILADAAEVLNNKLYLLGGGWERITVAGPVPTAHSMAIAMAISVPWNETNQLHNIEVELADQDGAQLLKVEGQVEVGRPPGIPLGQAQRVQMAISVGLRIEKLGRHVVVARIEGQEAKRLAFDIVAPPPMGIARPAIDPSS